MAGDELLRQIATLLSFHIRDNDLLARLGGDEFGVLLGNCSEAPATGVAKTIREAINKFRFGWDEKSFAIGISIGLVSITPTSESVERILSAADTACYAARDGGRNRIHVFQPYEGEAALRHGEMQWITEIQQALDDYQFALNAQPIVPVDHRDNIYHYEVLIRILDSDGNTIPPGAF